MFCFCFTWFEAAGILSLPLCGCIHVDYREGAVGKVQALEEILQGFLGVFQSPQLLLSAPCSSFVLIRDSPHYFDLSSY